MGIEKPPALKKFETVMKILKITKKSGSQEEIFMFYDVALQLGSGSRISCTVGSLIFTGVSNLWALIFGKN